MKHFEYKEATGLGYITLYESDFFIDKNWLIRLLTNHCYSEQKLNLELDVIVNTITNHNVDDLMLCIEGIFDKDNLQILSIEYIILADSNNQFEVNNEIYVEDIISEVNKSINKLNE